VLCANALSAMRPREDGHPHPLGQLDRSAAAEQDESQDGDGGDEVAEELVGGADGGNGDFGGTGGEGDGDEAVFAAEAGVDGGAVSGDAPGGVVAAVED